LATSIAIGFLSVPANSSLTGTYEKNQAAAGNPPSEETLVQFSQSQQEGCLAADCCGDD